VSNPSTTIDTTASKYLVARYEELRQQVRRPDAGHGMGLTLFIHQGMKIWMEAWSRCAPSSPGAEQNNDEILSPKLQSDMTMILAGMVLNAWQKEQRCWVMRTRR
jgi:hypothetical protein